MITFNGEDSQVILINRVTGSIYEVPYTESGSLKFKIELKKKKRFRKTTKNIVISRREVDVDISALFTSDKTSEWLLKNDFDIRIIYNRDLFTSETYNVTDCKIDNISVDSKDNDLIRMKFHLIGEVVI